MNQNTNVNLIPKFPFSGNLYFSQYDVGRVATINLVEDGTAYTIPSGATVKIQATKPSGLGFSVDCTYSGNVVTVVSTETMTNEYGRFPCELRIESGDVLLGTTNFTFNVEKSPHPTNTVDGDSGDIINQITVALNNALSDIEDAKEEALEEISQSGGGITEAVKQALLNCFAHVAWIDDQGQTYYDALEDALYPPANLVSISAVYTQSGNVYDTDSLDSLKSDLIVTAHYSDSSTETVPSTDYTLSGTLTAGTSVITVTYEGLTTTFNVVVTAWTWVYKASDGQTLSQRTDLFTTGASAGTLTEAISDGLLHLTATNNGGQKYWAFISPTTNTNAVMEMRIKYAQVVYAADYSNLQIQLSNGTGGAKVGASRNGNYTADPKFATIIGSSTTWNPDIVIDDWYVVRIKIEDGKQSVYVNGVAVIENQNLCTSYCLYNRIFMQAPNNNNASPSEVYIDYIAYKNGD